MSWRLGAEQSDVKIKVWSGGVDWTGDEEFMERVDVVRAAVRWVNRR